MRSGSIEGSSQSAFSEHHLLKVEGTGKTVAVMVIVANAVASEQMKWSGEG